MKSRLWIIALIGGLGVLTLLTVWHRDSTIPPANPTSSTSSPLSTPDSLSTPAATNAESAINIAVATHSITSTLALPPPVLTPTPLIHIVQAGETPFSIAGRYNISTETLMTTNNITDPTTLQIGEELVIPVDEQPRLTNDPVLIYEIQDGDTLFALANRYGTTMEEILAHNSGLEPTALQVGLAIRIPQTPSNPARSPLPTPTSAEMTINSSLPSPTPAASPPASSLGLYELSVEMINAVNTERQDDGLPPLEPDETLAAVALNHAQDMINRNYFDHVTPEGKTLRDRLQEQGLTLQWVGENIQRNTDPPGQTVQTAIKWFMNSKPHRNNILHDHYTHIGVGAVESPPGWYTFVLVFAQP